MSGDGAREREREHLMSQVRAMIWIPFQTTLAISIKSAGEHTQYLLLDAVGGHPYLK